MSPINTPPEGRGSINLKARAFIQGSYRECFILEASAVTQTAQIQISGSLFVRDVPFSAIASVSLVYDDGTVIKSFGAPRVSRPESVEFAQREQVDA